MGIASIGSGNVFQRWIGQGVGRVSVVLGVAITGFSVVLGSAAGAAQAAAGAQAAPPALTLSASSVSASRTTGVKAVDLRPNATYELISRKTRTDAASTLVSGSKSVTVLAQVKADKSGRFSTRFVVPLNWRNDHLIEVRKVKGSDLVERAHDWLTVTPPRPSLALPTDTVHRGSGFEVVLSGLRAHAKYEVFNSRSRDVECDCGGDSSSDGPALTTVRTDANGRAVVTIMVLVAWHADHLIEVRKAKGRNVVGGANAWLTVLR